MKKTQLPSSFFTSRWGLLESYPEFFNSIGPIFFYSRLKCVCALCCAANKKRKQSEKSLSNLNKGRERFRRKRFCKENESVEEPDDSIPESLSASDTDTSASDADTDTDTDTADEEPEPPFKDASTTMHQRYSLAASTTDARGNKTKTRCVDKQREQVTDVKLKKLSTGGLPGLS